MLTSIFPLEKAGHLYSLCKLLQLVADDAGSLQSFAHFDTMLGSQARYPVTRAS